jgi:hypothetical protein
MGSGVFYALRADMLYKNMLVVSALSEELVAGSVS